MKTIELNFGDMHAMLEADMLAGRWMRGGSGRALLPSVKGRAGLLAPLWEAAAMDVGRSASAWFDVAAAGGESVRLVSRGDITQGVADALGCVMRREAVCRVASRLLCDMGDTASAVEASAQGVALRESRMSMLLALELGRA